MSRAASQVYDEGQDEKANQSHYLDAGEDELDFAKNAHVDQVEDEDEDKNDGDPYGGLHFKLAVTVMLTSW
jgi:hypothetical protein